MKLKLPKHIMESGLDMNEVDDRTTSEMIDENCQYWDGLDRKSRIGIARWWLMNFEQVCREVDDVPEMWPEPQEISETELIQYITEYGYLIR